MHYNSNSSTTTGPPAVELGPWHLYFGCQSSDSDFLYKQELLDYQERGLVQMHLAFSREQAHKVYVQHLLEKNSASVWEMITQGGVVYVCGATSMGRDVKQTIVRMAMQHGGMAEKDAQSYVKKMQKSDKYIVELW